MSETTDSPDQILDVAQQLVQDRGYNAFSMSDIGEQLGVRNASVQAHYPSKAVLGEALVRRYRTRLEQTLESMDRGAPPPTDLLWRYFAAYRAVVHDDGRICLCTVLAGDFNTLPTPVQAEVRAFFDVNEAWLTRVLTQGRHAGELRFTGEPAEAASAFLASFEGAMVLARSYRDARRFETLGRRAIEGLLGT